MNGKRNLFTSLHCWARRQDENFTTEGLATVLELLLEREPTVGLSVLRRLSGGVLDPSQDSARLVRIDTQPRTPEWGVPDVKISAPDLLVYVEAKVFSGLGKGQLESYRRALIGSGLPRTGLVLLTHYPITGTISQDVHTVRWYQIAEWLEAELNQGLADPACQYLTAEFLDFLRGRGLGLIPVRSQLSKAINAYQGKMGPHSVLEKRIRSLKRIAAEPKLQPLTSLLTLMDQALQVLQLSERPRLDSGKPHGGWIGYNINSMEYFFCIYFKDPDAIVFETFDREVDQEACSGRGGETFVSWGALRWRDILDLADPTVDFFTKPKGTQINILERFVRDSFDTAQIISRPKRR